MLPTFGFDFTLTNCFKGDYLRNNKSSDVKNLRCFPRCRDACKGGHSEKGFCGNAVKGVLKIVGMGMEDIYQLQVVGEFQIADEDPSIAIPEVHKQHLQDSISLNTAYEGNISIVKCSDYSSCDENKVIEIAVEFTPRQCWTYLWKSCRWTNAQEHAFHVYILAPIPGHPDFLARVAQFSSPSFLLSCMRRFPGKSKASQARRLKREQKALQALKMAVPKRKYNRKLKAESECIDEVPPIELALSHREEDCHGGWTTQQQQQQSFGASFDWDSDSDSESETEITQRFPQAQIGVQRSHQPNKLPLDPLSPTAVTFEKAAELNLKPRDSGHPSSPGFRADAQKSPKSLPAIPPLKLQLPVTQVRAIESQLQPTASYHQQYQHSERQRYQQLQQIQHVSVHAASSQKTHLLMVNKGITDRPQDDKVIQLADQQYFRRDLYTIDEDRKDRRVGGSLPTVTVTATTDAHIHIGAAIAPPTVFTRPKPTATPSALPSRTNHSLLQPQDFHARNPLPSITSSRESQRRIIAIAAEEAAAALAATSLTDANAVTDGCCVEAPVSSRMLQPMVPSVVVRNRAQHAQQAQRAQSVTTVTSTMSVNPSFSGPQQTQLPVQQRLHHQGLLADSLLPSRSQALPSTMESQEASTRALAPVPVLSVSLLKQLFPTVPFIDGVPRFEEMDDDIQHEQAHLAVHTSFIARRQVGGAGEKSQAHHNSCHPPPHGNHPLFRENKVQQQQQQQQGSARGSNTGHGGVEDVGIGIACHEEISNSRSGAFNDRIGYVDSGSSDSSSSSSSSRASKRCRSSTSSEHSNDNDSGCSGRTCDGAAGEDDGSVYSGDFEMGCGGGGGGSSDSDSSNGSDTIYPLSLCAGSKRTAASRYSRYDHRKLSSSQRLDDHSPAAAAAAAAGSSSSSSGSTSTGAAAPLTRPPLAPVMGRGQIEGNSIRNSHDFPTGAGAGAGAGAYDNAITATTNASAAAAGLSPAGMHGIYGESNASQPLSSSQQKTAMDIAGTSERSFCIDGEYDLDLSPVLWRRENASTAVVFKTASILTVGKIGGANRANRYTRTASPGHSSEDAEYSSEGSATTDISAPAESTEAVLSKDSQRCVPEEEEEEEEDEVSFSASTSTPLEAACEHFFEHIFSPEPLPALEHMGTPWQPTPSTSAAASTGSPGSAGLAGSAPWSQQLSALSASSLGNDAASDDWRTVNQYHSDFLPFMSPVGAL